mgnify:CR=1 FL=1
MEALAYTKLEWTSADWRHMGGALPCCTKLKSLSLFEMSMDDAAMIALCGDLGSGGLHGSRARLEAAPPPPPAPPLESR